jgi:anti-anti-sigma factor
MNLEDEADVGGEGQYALTIELADRGDTGIPLVIISGEVDSFTADQLRQSVLAVLRQHRDTRIELDCRGVTFLDSTGIRTLVLCQAEAEQAGCHLTVVDPHPAVYQVLQITGLLDHFHITAPAAGHRAAGVSDGRHRG